MMGVVSKAHFWISCLSAGVLAGLQGRWARAAQLIRIEATRSGRFYPVFKEAPHAS
jgi:hypothetical protein